MSFYRSSRIVYAVVIVAALALGYASFTGWAIALVVGSLLALLTFFARRMEVVHVAVGASRALAADDPDAAQAALDRARAARVPLGAAPLVVASVEAEIALLRGRVDEVREIVARALERPPDPFDPVSDREARRGLTAVGAIADATADRSEDAVRAAEALERDEQANLRALARAGLARAIVLARSGRRAELGELLRERRTTLDLGSSARERTLLRAFGKLARSPAPSVYRRSAGATASGEAGWVEAAAGDAAELLVEREARVEPVAARIEQARTPPAKKPATRAQWTQVAVLWGLVVALVMVILQIAPSSPGATEAIAGATSLAGWLDPVGAVAILLAGALLYRRIRRGLRDWERTAPLMAAYVRGDEAEARQGLAAIAAESNAALAASGSLSLCTLELLSGEPTAARAAAEAGLARLASLEIRLATMDMLYPELVAHWAFALAAEGDPKAARGALASMPDYWRAVRSRFRVELLARWREGDEVGAAEWAERAPRDMTVGADDDLLADAIRAAVRGEALGGLELRRIADDVGHPRWRRFLDGVAPGLAPRVLAHSADAAADAADLDAAAEAEAAAEEEIAKAGFAVARGT